MSNIRKSLAISFAEKYAVIAVQFSSTLILARLLTPEEIGIYSVGALVVGFAHMLRDFGVSNYIVQETELSRERLSTAFTVTLVFAWCAAGALYIVSYPLSEFYDQPGIEQIVKLLTINFLLIPFSSTIFALFRRELKFKVLFWIGLLNTIVNSLTSCLLAYYEFGFISLAWGAIAGTLCTVILSILYRPSGSTFFISTMYFKEILNFGSRSSIASLAIEFGYSSPELIIGKILDFHAVGLFSRAQGLATLFNKLITSAIQTVAVPFFAKTNREARQLDSLYYRTIDILIGVSWPFYAFMAIFSYEIILVLFGQQWTETVPLAQILCLAFALRLIPSVNGWVMLSIGAVHQNMIARLYWEGFSVLLVLVSVFYGLEAACYALVLANVLGSLIFHFYLNLQINISRHTIFKILYRNFAITFITTCLLIPIYRIISIHIDSIFSRLLFGSVIFCIVWLFLVIFLHSEIRNELIRVVSNFLPNLKSNNKYEK